MATVTDLIGRRIRAIRRHATELVVMTRPILSPWFLCNRRESWVDPRSFQEMHKALGIMKLVSQGEQDVTTGRTESHENVMKDARARIAQARGSRRNLIPSASTDTLCRHGLREPVIRFPVERPPDQIDSTYRCVNPLR